ncbi:hypothetical protein [Vibrio owensii]|uniref:hypothetical protein n=1 Tax=Vibrio owensii TaxID=696485 RepID=UPI0018F218D5|nr:hypothetical protein [Vibrio owensii]
MLKPTAELEQLAIFSLAGGNAIVNVKPSQSNAQSLTTLDDKVELSIDNVPFGLFSSHYTAFEHTLTLINENPWDDDIDFPFGLHQAVELANTKNLNLFTTLLRGDSDEYRLQVCAATSESEAIEQALNHAPKDKNFINIEAPTLIATSQAE